MVKKLPAASDFGLDQRPSFRFQFSIRALLIVTAAAAVIAAGVSQRTIPYWQFTMAGLVGLEPVGNVAGPPDTEQGAAGGCRGRARGWIRATQPAQQAETARYAARTSELRFRRRGLPVAGFRSWPILTRWLVAQGYERCRAAARSLSSSCPIRRRRSAVESGARRLSGTRERRRIRRESRFASCTRRLGSHLQFCGRGLRVGRRRLSLGNQGATKASLKQFAKETAAKWQEYLRRSSRRIAPSHDPRQILRPSPGDVRRDRRAVRFLESAAVAGHRSLVAAEDGQARAAGGRCADPRRLHRHGRSGLGLLAGVEGQVRRSSAPISASRCWRSAARSAAGAGRRQEQITLLEADTLRLPFPDDTFQIVSRGLRAAERERHRRRAAGNGPGVPAGRAGGRAGVLHAHRLAARGHLRLVLPARPAPHRPGTGSKHARPLTIISRRASAASPRARRWPSGCGRPDWAR